MVTPAVGAVVLVPFPFSDLSASKRRPALALAYAGREDWICLQITSNPYGDPMAVELTDTDFSQGSLQRTSYLRPGKLFTAHSSLFQRVVGRIQAAKLDQVREVVIRLIRTGQAPGGNP
jgi:mRNA interferase MazF